MMDEIAAREKEKNKKIKDGCWQIIKKYDKSANYPNTNIYKRDIIEILSKGQGEKLRYC